MENVRNKKFQDLTTYAEFTSLTMVIFDEGVLLII